MRASQSGQQVSSSRVMRAKASMDPLSYRDTSGTHLKEHDQGAGDSARSQFRGAHIPTAELCVYLCERVVGQTVVESACEQGKMLRAVQPQHGVQKHRTTRQHHRMELWEKNKSSFKHLPG